MYIAAWIRNNNEMMLDVYVTMGIFDEAEIRKFRIGELFLLSTLTDTYNSND